MIDMFWVVVGVGGFVAVSMYRAYRGGGVPSTHRKLDPGEQARVVVNTVECAGCAPTQTFLKGRDRIMVTLQPPGDGRAFVKEYHRTELEADPIGILMGRIQLNEKVMVPTLGEVESEFEEPEDVVKRRVENPSMGRKFEQEQRNFFDAAEEYSRKFMAEKMQPPTVERTEEAVDRVLVNGSAPDEPEPAPPKMALRASVSKSGKESWWDGRTRIKREEYEKRLQEAKDARR